MRILLIGDVNSSFVRDYAKHLKERKQSDLKIDLFATITPFTPEGGGAFNKIFSYTHFAIFGYNQKSRVLYRTWSLLMFLLIHGREYDCIHVHYVLVDFILISFVNRFSKQKVIITVYGSDFNKISYRTKKLLTPFFTRATYITFANENTALALRTFYGFGEEKIKICRFGLSPLEKIREIQAMPTAKSREISGLPLNRIIIAIGYNFNRDQQHIEILRSITENKNLFSLKDKITFVFPLTYGTELHNRQRILALLKSFPYSVNVYLEFLREEKLAHLRRSCDIMIQVQKNDQFSGSMQEHLFAGNIVITGSWLPYATFKRAGVYFREINKINEIGENLSSCIEQLSQEKEKSKMNGEVIYQMSSWANTIDSWINLYKVPVA